MEEENVLKTSRHACATQRLQNLDQYFEVMESVDDAAFNILRVFRRKLNETKFCKVKQSALGKYFFIFQ